VVAGVPAFQTVTFSVQGGVGRLTLNRPEALNSFNQQMMDECSAIWRAVRDDDSVRVVVVRASGDRAFSTGVDTKEGYNRHRNLFSRRDPGQDLAPKSNECWKPVICAVNGMAAGGAFYWINEADIVICSQDATFFDPHVSYGLTSALEPAGLARRIPYGEVMRWALTSCGRAPTSLRRGSPRSRPPQRRARSRRYGSSPIWRATRRQRVALTTRSSGTRSGRPNLPIMAVRPARTGSCADHGRGPAARV
jgi:Enoyl-CoA hydratase/isomerase